MQANSSAGSGSISGVSVILEVDAMVDIRSHWCVYGRKKFLGEPGITMEQESLDSLEWRDGSSKQLHRQGQRHEQSSLL